MKPKTHKLLSILLALVLLCSLAGPLAPSARADGPYKVSLDAMEHGSVTRSAETAAAGDTITLTPVPDTGYILNLFAVYTTDYMHTVDITVSGDGFVFTMPAEDVHVLATFKVPNATYTVTFDPNGGEGTMEPQTFTDGETWTIPECAFTPPEGKVFDSWLISPVTGTQPHFPHVGNPGSGLGFDFDAIAQAQWKDAPSTTEIPSVGLSLTLPAAGGSYSGAVPAAVSISSGTGFTVKSANWFNGGTPETNPGCGLAPTSFEPGKPYYAEIFLAPAEGYAFADGTAVTIDTLGVKSNRVIDNEVDRMGWLSIVTNDYTIPAAAATTYTITVTGGTAHANEIGEYGDSIGAVITEAAEGDKVWLVADYEAVPEGKWAYGWTSEDVSISRGYNSFTMPAKPVTVAANYEDRVDKTYDLSSGATGSLSDGDSDSINYLLNENLVNADQDVSTWDPYTKQLKIDLDKDGSYDLTFRRDEGYTVLESNSVSDQISFTLTTPALWIKSVTFLFKAAAVPYTVDLSTGKMDLATGQEFADLFKSLGAWTHMSSTSGSSTYYYDLDKDGTEDISVTNSSSSRNVLLLTTSNITTDTYVISDSTGPYNPITFILKAPTVTNYPVTLIAYDKTNGTEQAGGEVAFSDSGKGTRISGDYEGNSSRTVGVYPASDYTFIGWAKGSPSGEIVSTSSPYTFTVTEDVTLYALFEKITTYPVWVGETQVTDANKDDILGDGGKAKYDPDSKTLTLDNPSITTVHNGDAICTESGSLTIKGTATLSASVFSRADLTLIDANLTCTRISSYNTTRIESGTINVTSRGIACYSGHLEINGGELTVTSADGYGVNAPVRISGGTVDITGKTSGIYTSNISDNKAVEITGGTVTVTGTGENGIYSPSGGVTISGGTVTATGGENGIFCEKYDGKILISGGTVKATGTSGDGISGICPIDITGGTVEATGGSAGIRTNRSITIGNSITKVTADGATNAIRGFDILLGDALIIQEPAGGTIGYMGGGNIVLDGENAATHAVIVPGTVVTTYPVWVGGEQVTSANKDDILGDGKAKYDPDTKTLALDNPMVSTSYNGALIYTEGIDLNITGKATLKNENTAYGVLVKDGSLNSDANLTVEVRQYGVSATKSININGGSVNSKTTGHGSDGVGYALGGSDLKISSGTVTATSAQGPAISTTNSVEISGGTVNVTGGFHGISTKSLAISGGTVTVEGDWNGIKAEENITISGGTVAAKSNKSSYKGIYAGGTIEIKNGTACVTADGNSGAIEGSKITLGDALMIQEPTGGKLSGDGKVIQNADDTVATHTVIVPKEAATHTVTFEANGGTPVPAAQTVADGGKATKPADPTRSGFVFDGWYADATFSVAFDFDAPITADVTVYAKWKEETAPGDIVYTVVSGGNSTWTKGSSSGVTIVVKRNVDDDTCFSHFTSVQIGSTTLAGGTDYTAVAGSTVITLNASALQKLTTGTKTVTINFDDGKAATDLTIKAGSSGTGGSTSPKTGDDSKPGLWLAVMMLSGLGIGGLVVNDKKRRYVSRH